MRSSFLGYYCSQMQLNRVLNRSKASTKPCIAAVIIHFKIIIVLISTQRSTFENFRSKLHAYRRSENHSLLSRIHFKRFVKVKTVWKKNLPKMKLLLQLLWYYHKTRKMYWENNFSINPSKIWTRSWNMSKDRSWIWGEVVCMRKQTQHQTLESNF